MTIFVFEAYGFPIRTLVRIEPVAYIDRVSSKPVFQSSFPATKWTLIAHTKDVDPEVKAVALEELCQIYWAPVYAFIRSSGKQPADAEDLTQSFFADFLSRENFGKADRTRGKLRTFLLRSVSNFVKGDYRKQTRQKRGGSETHISFDVMSAHGVQSIIEPQDSLTPQKIFEQQWALTILAKALKTVEDYYESKQQGDFYRKISFSIDPGSDSQSYQSIANSTGKSESAIKVAIYRLRQRYADILREVVAGTLLKEEDIEGELNQLRGAFD